VWSRYTKGSCYCAMTSEDRVYHKLTLHALELMEEAAQRGQELSYNIAWMRAVGQYNRDPKEWAKRWRKTKKKYHLF
jgi:hypothetical protein